MQNYIDIIHFLESEDYTNLWCSLRQKVSLVEHDKACPGQATFGHITGGYDAGYYGYDRLCPKGLIVTWILILLLYSDTLILLYLLRICIVSDLNLVEIFESLTASLPATVFKADPLDPARGKLYRDKVLRAGGSREEYDTLEVWK